MPVRNANLKYERISVEEIYKHVKVFEEQFIKFISIRDYPEDIEFSTSVISIIETIIRVDKRKAYYYCFHGMEINECKVAALYAYWILKFRPFTITDKRYINTPKGCCINEEFAIYMICSILVFSGKITPTAIDNTSYYEKLLYSFHFRNFTIDSLVMMIESINTETFNKQYDDLR